MLPSPLLTQLDEFDNKPELYVAEPVTVNVPPVLFVNVVLPFEYVPPVIVVSKYGDALKVNLSLLSNIVKLIPLKLLRTIFPFVTPEISETPLPTV
jgi:hypothetical protein